VIAACLVTSVIRLHDRLLARQEHAYRPAGVRGLTLTPRARTPSSRRGTRRRTPAACFGESSAGGAPEAASTTQEDFDSRGAQQQHENAPSHEAPFPEGREGSVVRQHRGVQIQARRPSPNPRASAGSAP